MFYIILYIIIFDGYAYKKNRTNDEIPVGVSLTRFLRGKRIVVYSDKRHRHSFCRMSRIGDVVQLEALGGFDEDDCRMGDKCLKIRFYFYFFDLSRPYKYTFSYRLNYNIHLLHTWRLFLCFHPLESVG